MPAHDAGLASDRALIEDAVRAAGAIARKFYGGDYKRWDKGKGQPVTEADLAVDTYLRETLTAARPGYGWLSEETEDDPSRLSKQSLFVVDPIDGTVAFLKNRPHFTVCAALVREERPVIGVVYNPVLDECYAATLGEGALRNGQPIHVSSRAELEGCRMCAAKSMFEHPAWDNPPNRPWPPMHIETRNSVAYRMALVADGSFDATLALSAKRDWDMAAADIIVREAGGIVTAHDGSVPRYNRTQAIQPSLIAAGPELHKQILSRVRHIKL
ncbi:MAG TPA: 3'(2'),5'-bisphosphate nucleotidase CysQ [Rhizomicrobium sp.]|nr:3'(2'),5'-bisphosphate nucleotidase CysQ [Rhizomicrobium sp.]